MPLLITLALPAFSAQALPQVVLQTVEVRIPDGRRAVRFPLGVETLEFAISGFDVDITSLFVPDFGVTDGDGQLTGIVRARRAGFIGVARPAHSNADTVTFGDSRVGSVLIAGDEPAWFVDEREIGAEALTTFTAAPAPLLSGRVVDPRGAEATLSVVRLADRASGQIDALEGSFACRIVPGATGCTHSRSRMRGRPTACVDPSPSSSRSRRKASRSRCPSSTTSPSRASLAPATEP